MSDDLFDTESEPSADELQQAEALARALDRGHADEALPAEAFETAALLRHAGPDGELSARQSEALLSELLERWPGQARPPAARPRWGWRWGRRSWHWGVAAGGLAAAAAIVIWLVRPTALVAPSPTSLPAPPASLLSAQLDRLAGDRGSDGDSDGDYGEAMAGYRAEVYGALERRYGRR